MQYINNHTEKMTISWIHRNPSLFIQFLEGGEIKFKQCRKCHNFKKLAGIKTHCCKK